ncbi:hypothetical protein B5G00_08350 [Blautia sp. An46]|nr:hypothetical protein B5G00_08350 [Blautia sp. An46]
MGTDPFWRGSIALLYYFIRKILAVGVRFVNWKPLPDSERKKCLIIHLPGADMLQLAHGGI